MKSTFSDQNIIKLVARIKAKKTLQRSDDNFYRNISSAHGVNSTRTEIDTICPPRKQWVRLKKAQREKLSPIKQIEKTVYVTIIRKLRENNDDDSPWKKNLRGLIGEIQRTVFDDKSFEFQEPRIFPELKDKAKSSFRPISNFSLRERIVASLTSRYLTECFEKLWVQTNCAYAFRSSQRKITHHTAVENIIRHRKAYETLFAAECDIKKFFDSVNHERALEILLDDRIELENHGITIDENAIRIFTSYLNCYSFHKSVTSKSKELLRAELSKYPQAHFEWIEKEIKVKKHLYIDKIGIPQGGALSCFIANLMLHQVDKKIMQNNDPELFYGRYCDDMVVIHPNQTKCEAYLDLYINELEKLDLFHHKPQKEKYGKAFWDVKSKSTYRWAQKTQDCESVPWLAFVGYQIRHDSVVRVRPKAIKKEKEKQVKVVDKILKALNVRNKKKAESNLNIHTSQVVFRARKKLLAMSVGAISERQLANSEGKFCWADGFKVLKKNDFIAPQIKQLDAHRIKQIFRLRSQLSDVKSPKIVKANREIRFKNHDDYWLSYFYQFVRSKQ